MSGRNLGLNVIGRFDHLELYSSDFPRVTDEVVNSTVDLKVGSIVKLNANGTISLVDNIADTVHGILANDLGAGEIGTVYLTGKFAGAYTNFGTPISSWQALKPSARRSMIFLAEIYQG